jgi:hypothetical protein
MKVVINNKVGVFQYTKEQAEWLFNKAIIQSVISPLISDIISSFGDKNLAFVQLDNYNLRSSVWHEYKYRSHPWIVEACEKFPDASQKIEEIRGSYYRIIERKDGTEYIITPSLGDFIKGFEWFMI